ncbi:MAG: FimB/Mfa2 family fimbrial subunit [Prevotellaceae bacterium]|nr:FimB/Mfa2 family fimbrial subunit [Candidatus Minthosoma caballi]
MKKENKLIPGMMAIFSVVAFVLIALTSCESQEYNDLKIDKEYSNVSIVTRSNDGTPMEYPLHVYAFDKDGKLEDEQTIASADESLALSLPKGESCRVVAVCANDEVYNIPASPTLSSVITMKAKSDTDVPNASEAVYSTDHPLQMGYASITPTAASSTLSIQMHYKVCSLNVSLVGMLAECTNASISIESPVGGVNMNGVSSGSTTITIPIKKSAADASNWTTSTVYMFPTTGEQTVFTITYSDGTTEHSSAATYLSTLKAGIPYSITGTYDSGKVTVTGDITPSTWGDPVNIAFTFGENTNATIDASGTEAGSDDDAGNHGGDNQDQTEAITSNIPAPYSVWNGHLVAALYDADGNQLPEAPASPASETEYSVLLMSLKDWNNATPSTAATLAAGYAEGEMDSWSIPTTDEARAIYKAFSVAAFKTAISNASADAIDKSANSVRYLCENATKYFSFAYTSFSSYGATDATYHLRLVKRVKIKNE